MRSAFPLLLPLVLSFLTACAEKPESAPDAAVDGGSNGITVLTTCYPMQYFAERIAGEHLDVQFPLPDGADPILWQPDSASILRFQAADLIVINGAHYEKWVTTVSLPENRVIDASRSFEQDLIRYETSTSHRHGPEGEHTHSGIDGHTWLDPINAKVQAATIRQAFAKKWPAHAESFERNLQALIADLDALDEQLKGIEISRPLLASQPAYGYLARRYGWQVTNLELDPETLPGKDAIPADSPAKIILWQSRPRDVVSALLEKQYGIEGIVFSPAERKSDQDYLATMRANIEALRSEFK